MCASLSGCVHLLSSSTMHLAAVTSRRAFVLVGIQDRWPNSSSYLLSTNRYTPSPIECQHMLGQQPRHRHQLTKLVIVDALSDLSASLRADWDSLDPRLNLLARCQLQHGNHLWSITNVRSAKVVSAWCEILSHQLFQLISALHLDHLECAWNVQSEVAHHRSLRSGNDP